MPRKKIECRIAFRFGARKQSPTAIQLAAWNNPPSVHSIAVISRKLFAPAAIFSWLKCELLQFALGDFSLSFHFIRKHSNFIAD